MGVKQLKQPIKTKNYEDVTNLGAGTEEPR